MFRNISAGLILMAWTQSCKVTEDYQRPELSVPDSYETALLKNDYSVVEIPSYKQFFSDEKLLALIDEAMENNPDLEIAAENMLATEAVLKNVKLNYLPEVNLQVNAGVQRLSSNSMTGSFAGNFLFEEYNLASSVSWDLDFWGKLKRQREEALANYLSQAENRRAVRVQLIAQVADAYYNLLSLDQQLRITQEVEKSMQETLNILQVQYRVGEVSSLAIQQSAAQLSETRGLIPEIKASIKAQENALQALVGQYPSKVERFSTFTSEAFSMPLEAGIPMDLLQHRPDVKQQELLLMSANARVGIAKTDFYPSLQITAQGGLNSIKASNWFSIPASLFGTAAAGLTQPIFYKRRIKSSYETALHLREAAVHEFRKSVVNAVAEVSTSMSNINRIKEQMTEVNNRKSTLQKAITDAQMLYKFGDANYLEILIVQQNYYQAELANTVTMQKEINAYISLYKSLGGN